MRRLPSLSKRQVLWAVSLLALCVIADGVMSPRGRYKPGPRLRVNGQECHITRFRNSVDPSFPIIDKIIDKRSR